MWRTRLVCHAVRLEVLERLWAVGHSVFGSDNGFCQPVNSYYRRLSAELPENLRGA
jgi:hypothetical protein